MNMGGDAAERLVRDSLMITEEAVKLAGLGAKNLAAILVALAKEEEKTHGPTHLTRLLRSGEELKLLCKRLLMSPLSPNNNTKPMP